jgi:MFS transporter, AAHS family, 3-hydroxyphenylpropionic acid transporter
MPNSSGSSNAATTTIVCCVLVAFCEGFDLQAAGVAAVGIAPEFKPTPEQLGRFFSASTFGLFLGALGGGRLADTLGRRSTLIASIALFGLFSILTAQAWSIASLTGARLLTGLGLGGAFPTLVAWVNEHSAPTRRRANVALVYSGMPFGGALVSLMSMLTESAHWRLIFIAGGIAPLLLVPILLWALHEALPVRGATGALEDGAAHATMPKTGSFIAIFGDGRALATLLLWVSCFLGLLTVYLMLSWLPTMLRDAGFSKIQAGCAQIAFNAGGALSALLLGELLESKMRNPSIAVTLIAAPFLVFLLSRSSHEFGLAVAAAFGLGGALLAAQGYFYASAASIYPTSIRGVGSGATVAAGRLGSIVGPLLGGLLTAAGHRSTQLLSEIVPLVVLGSLTAFAFAWQTSRARGAAAAD